MSADNWAICPQCWSLAVAANRQSRLDAGAAYGKVDPEEYLRMLAESKKEPDTTTFESTLREDYELGVNEDGQFYVSYGCSCRCGYSFKFKHEQQTEKKAPKLKSK